MNGKGKGAFEALPAETEELASRVVEAAFRVHRALGPGLLEIVYEACLCHELSKLDVPFKRQVDVPVRYDTVRLDAGVRLDMVVDDSIIVELKAVEKLLSLHEAQLLTYMKLTGVRLGFLINFNVVQLKDGLLRRIL
jgi:GxxExxY protein